MFIKYFILCIAGSCIQVVWGKSSTSGPGMFDQPLWMSNNIGQIIMGLLAISSLVMEIILGIIKISWWAWLLFIIAGYVVSSIFFLFILNKNIQVTFMFGISLFIILLILIL